MRRLVLAFLVIGVLVIALGSIAVFSARDAFQHRARVAAENLTASLAQGVDAELAQVDTVLRNVILQLRLDEKDGSSDSHHAQTVLARQLSLVPELVALGVADAQGLVTSGQSGLSLDDRDLHDADFFRRARVAESDALAVSEPLRLAGGGGKWALFLARRLESPDGSFAGIAFAGLSTEHFHQLFESVDIGGNGAITLRTDSMKLVARYSPGGESTAEIASATVSAELSAAVRANPRQGVFTAKTASDQVERISAYRQVGDRPLRVLVGFDTATYFGPWRLQALHIAILLVIVLVALAVSAAYILNAWRRETRYANAVLSEGLKNHALLLTASDGIHVLDREGHLVELSDSFAEMLGSVREELLGRHVSTWDASLKPQAMREWTKRFGLNERHKFETRHRRKDGALIEVEITCAGVRIADRELIYCSSRDISDRKRFVRAQAESSRQIQDLYDNAPCGYHSLDDQGRYVHVNATELAWLGLEKEDLVGKRYAQDFLSEQGRTVFAQRYPEVKARGRIDDVEFDLVCKGGETRRVSMTSTAVVDADGNFLRSRCVLFDITELHQARDSLLKISREQQAMLDNELIGIAKFRGHQIVWKNTAMDSIFGYSGGELLGQSSRVLHLDDDAFANEVRIADPLLHSGRHYRRQLQMLRKDGQRIWIDASGALISSAAGETLWMFTDITLLKQSQAHVEHMAFHDQLTGLPNRMLLTDRLRHALVNCLPPERVVAVCFLDLDGFKKVNDELGHAAGDLLLQEVANRLRSCVRSHDTVSRFGGDEFVLLMTDLRSRDECLSAMARAASEICKPFEQLAGARVSVSTGVSFYPWDGREPDTLLALADAAMYEAKRSGKNRTVCCSTDITPASCG